MPGVALRLQDAGFEYGYVRGREANGARPKRWVPIGMPRLNPNFARCVFFLFGRDRKGKIKSQPEGTGVLIGARERIRGTGYFTHMYAVTCAHVAPQGASVMRVNTQEGNSRFIDLHPDIDWLTPTNGADLAAADITDQFEVGDDVRYLSTAQLATKGFVKTVEIGIGEDGFMLGLFSRLPGKDRNMVAAKFGNIALMADEAAPIGLEGRTPRPSHLFDIRSRGGFSGSPVFVYRTPDGDLRDIDDGVRRRTTVAPRMVVSADPRGSMREPMHAEADWALEYDMEDNIFLRLLGIHIGQYPEVVKARKLPKTKPISETDDLIRHGDRFVIEGGVTVVVPAWEILDLLNREEFVKRRAEREAQLDDSEPVPETAAEEPERPPIEGDAQHKERFTALLDEALGKPKQGD